jgi:TPP-dependent pyruvate/acetoin dehydrogenase alpha subunit
VKKGVLTSYDIAAIEERVNGEVERATAFASSSPMPELTELTTDIYA